MAMRFRALILSAAVAAALPCLAGGARASPIVPGFNGNSLLPNDDAYSQATNLGFDFNFFGTTYSRVLVANNGYIAFDTPTTPIAARTAFTELTRFPLIAPFFADVDTRVGNTVTFGTGTFGGRAAFGVSWPNVGYYDRHVDRLNDFQLLLVDRSDVAPGDADIYFNYGSIQWESGDADGGHQGLGGFCAHVGYTNGEGAGAGNGFEVEGSGVCFAMFDGSTTPLRSRSNVGVPGQFLFQARDGAMISTVVPDPAAVPEPASLALLVVGLAGLALRRR